MRKAAEKMAAAIRNWVVTAAEKLLPRNSPSGIIGSVARASRTTKPIIKRVPRISPNRFWELPQPAWPPCTSPQMRTPTPAETRTSAGTSSRAPDPRLSLRRSRAPRAATTPTGTFIQKIQCQFNPWVIAPPTSGPLATGHCQPGDPTPDSHDRAASRRGERRGQQRETQRHDDRRTQALNGTTGNERPCAGCQSARGRRGGEYGQARHVDTPASEPVSERGGGENPRPEGHGVGADRPLEGRDAPAQSAMYRRQRGDHHERVERHHEIRHRCQQHSKYAT